MNISGNDLLAEYERAKKNWPFIADMERAHKLPALLLYAVGSRESDLRNIKGDFSQRLGEPSKRFHGFGVWQRDSQHGVGESYLLDVRRQAEDAAVMLAENHAAFNDWAAAVAAYNCGPGNVRKALRNGESVDRHTTGHDYSADVLARHRFLAAAVQGHPAGGAQGPAGGHPQPDCMTVPAREFFTVGRRHPCFVAMGKRFQIWLGHDIHADANGYQPGPVFSSFDVQNVKACQRLMGDEPDGFFGPKQWKRLMTARRP